MLVTMNALRLLELPKGMSAPWEHALAEKFEGRRMASVGNALLLAAILAPQILAAVMASFASEAPWAAYHVNGLPAAIRRHIARRERVCGNDALAAYYFAISIEASGKRFVSLHFDKFRCANRAAVCLAIFVCTKSSRSEVADIASCSANTSRKSK